MDMSKKHSVHTGKSGLVRIVDETDRDQDDFDLTIEIRPAKKSHVLIRILPEDPETPEEPEWHETVSDDELPF